MREVGSVPLSLRNRAEEFIRKSRSDVAEVPSEEVQRLIYELQCYQVELEIQNEDLRRVQLELQGARDRYADLYDFAPVGYLSLDRNCRITEANLTVSNLLGVTRLKLIGKPLYAFLHKDDLATFEGHIKRVFFEEKNSCEVRALGGNELIWLRLNSVSHNGKWCQTIVTDITDQKRSENHRTMLMAELDHRVKNTLSLVQSIAQQTLKRATSFKGFRESFEGRIKALAEMQRLLTRNKWHGAALEEIVESVTKPYRSGGGPALKMSGVAFSLNATATQSFYLALHELSTNAAKYGAFSVPSGEVRASWFVREGRLFFEWLEVGGPEVAEVKSAGFGRKLLELSIEYDLKGKIRQEFHEGGLSCVVEIPLK